MIESAVAAGVDLIQIREKDLPTRALLALVEAVVARARGTATRIVVNDRLDVALAARADGVHLPGHGLPVAEVRRGYPELLIGASCHEVDELRAAETSGADFAVFGPVFAPLSKAAGRPPIGVEKLGEAVRAVRLPVLALGGITVENAAACLRAGAAGIAAITLFQKSADLGDTVVRLRKAQG
jgi:thiamine-phosphate pyrophosphorylase